MEKLKQRKLIEALPPNELKNVLKFNGYQSDFIEQNNVNGKSFLQANEHLLKEWIPNRIEMKKIWLLIDATNGDPFFLSLHNYEGLTEAEIEEIEGPPAPSRSTKPTKIIKSEMNKTKEDNHTFVQRRRQIHDQLVNQLDAKSNVISNNSPKLKIPPPRPPKKVASAETPTETKLTNFLFDKQVSLNEWDSDDENNFQTQEESYEQIDHEANRNFQPKPQNSNQRYHQNKIHKGLSDKSKKILYEDAPNVGTIPDSLKKIIKNEAPPVPQRPKNHITRHDDSNTDDGYIIAMEEDGYMVPMQELEKDLQSRPLPPNRPLPTPPRPQLITAHPSYREIDRPEGEKMLFPYAKGSFLIRRSGHHIATLVVKGDVKVFNIPIKTDSNGRIFLETQSENEAVIMKFFNVDELIKYYSLNVIPIENKHVYLINTYLN